MYLKIDVMLMKTLIYMKIGSHRKAYRQTVVVILDMIAKHTDRQTLAVSR